MQHRRLAAALVSGAALVAAVGGTATAASAAPAAPMQPAHSCHNAYPPKSSCEVTLTVTVVTPGGSFSFTIRGFFGPFEHITIYIHSKQVEVGTLTADANGTVSGTVHVPSNLAPGQHELVVTGDHGDSVTTPFTIASSTASGSSGSGTLPFTGAEIAAMSTVGGALLIGGGVAFGTGMARKRRSSTPAA